MYRQPRPIPVLSPKVGGDDEHHPWGLLPARLFYLFFFAAIGSLVPFLNVYFARQGLNGAQIGWLGSIAPLVALTANPIWGGIADRWHIHRQVLALCAFGAGAVSLLFLQVDTFWPLMAVVVVLTFFRTPIGALLDSAVLDYVRRTGGHYGRQRMWGGVGFVAVVLTLGRVLGAEQMEIAFWLHAGLMGLLCTGLAFAIPIRGRETTVSLWQGLRMLTGSRRYMSFLGAMALLGIGTSSYVNFLGLHVLALGGDDGAVAIAWALNGLAEIPIMFLGGRWFARYRYSRMLQVAFLSYAAVWLLMALAQSAYVLSGLAFLIGICYGTMWVSAVNYAGEAAPPGLSATAQALIGAAQAGFGWSVGAVLAGYVWDAADGSAVFWMAVLAALGAGTLFWWGNRAPVSQPAQAGGTP